MEDDSGPFPLDMVLLRSLNAAAQDGDPVALRSLLDSEDGVMYVDEPCSETGLALLMLAAGNGHVACMRMLLVDYACEVDLVNVKNGFTALHYALQGCHFDAARVLLEWGASPDQFTHEGQNGLMVSAENGDEACVRLLLECGANSDGANADNVTPLMAAVRGGSEPCVRLLLEYGADVHARDSDEYTALMIAVAYGAIECMGTLIQFGANVDAVSDKGESLLLIAARCLEEDIVCMLVNRRDTDTNAKDFKGRTALHALARVGFVTSNALDDPAQYLNIAQWLLRAGIAVDSTDIQDRTPLETVVHAPLLYAAHRDVFEFLLRLGANPNRNASDHRKQTALMTLLAGCSESSTSNSRTTSPGRMHFDPEHTLVLFAGRLSRQHQTRLILEYPYTFSPSNLPHV
ncbi:Ankyrin-1 [Porphyridium purpureum]|uniref:Ankyrin-1 n=1 Tax=Porphyridium purpureum TaxID=35688 RepID=A0A5J4Z3Q0_PORPP|nr:Ankyrin-1 [Porphyridium purpureum]|eukprot:POR0567..scf295_1